MTEDIELLAECLEAFEALSSSSPSPLARKLLQKRGTPHERFKGTSAFQLAKKMARVIRKHLAEEKA